jgi:hypothetical protein
MSGNINIQVAVSTGRIHSEAASNMKAQILITWVSGVFAIELRGGED